MDIEVIPAERPSGVEYRSEESNAISKSSYRKSTFNDKDEPTIISKSRKRCCSCIKSTTMRTIMFALFASLSITVGIVTVCFTSPKPSTTCELIFKRMGKSSIDLNSLPRSVALGDFNNDNRMDIVVANFGTNTIGIFLSYDDGTFAKPQTYFTGSESHPYSVAIKDFNNDTYLDIAVANYGTNNIGIFLGYGDGNFSNQNIFSTGSSHPLFIAIGDFNNDNRSDIVVVNYGTNNVGVLLGYGNGFFQVPITYFTGYDSIPYSLAVGDFNKDNQLDIAVTNYGTNNIGILLGNGNGSFTNQKIYTTGSDSKPSSIAAADLNNDNQLDIVVANNGTGTIGIFLGYSNGTFAPQKTHSIEFNSHPQYVTIVDIDKDNQLDVVIVDSINDKIHFLPGYGNGTFRTVVTYDMISGSQPYWVAIADFNNDNQLDVVIVNYAINNILVLLGYSSIPSARQKVYVVTPKDGSPTTVVINDFNNDDHLDIAINGNAQATILIFNGYENEVFVRGNSYSFDRISSPQYICISDLNKDNRMDIIGAITLSNNIGVLLGQNNEIFSTVKTYSTGTSSNPWSVAVGDVNNDNQTDIVSVNTGTNSVGIFLGYGNGTFMTMQMYSTGSDSSPYYVTLGDVNNDNQLDVVTANLNSDSVGVLLGHGNGSFGIITTYSTGVGSSPFYVTLADFNKDNYLDIVVTNIDTNHIGIFLGNKNGTFGIQMIYLTGVRSTPYIVVVADFNNDNQLDIAATFFGSGEVAVYFGFGNGSFELARRYSTGYGSHPYGIAAADLNNDKKLEIIVALWGTGSMGILTEYNAAVFANETTYSTGSVPNPYSVSVGDFNNDHRPDIVVANSGTDNLNILLGLGNGLFGTKNIYSIDIGSSPQFVITGDINKDNQPDIITANFQNNTISILLGYRNGTFASQIIYSTGDNSQPSGVALGDLNNDNRSDIVITNEGTDSIGVFLGFDYASFERQEMYSSVNNLGPYGLVVIDFNNDSYLDIVATYDTSNNIGILLGYGNGSFAPMVNYSTGDASTPAAVTVADLNNDGRLDIIVANFGTNNIGVFLGYSNETFAPMTTFSTGDYSNPTAVAVADLNNDDRLDIVVANTGTNNIGILLGYGNGTFASIVTYPTGDGSYPCAIILIDFNNDSQIDIAVVNRDTSNVGIFLGYGNGTFSIQVLYSAELENLPFWASVGDFNNDNRSDIVTANYNGNCVAVLLGYGNGTFADVRAYSTGAGSMPVAVSIADFNDDNQVDIVVANYGTNNIVILFGLGDGTFLLGKTYSTGSASTPMMVSYGDFDNNNRLDIVVCNHDTNILSVFLGYSSELFAGAETYSTGNNSQPHSLAIGEFNNDGVLDVVVANYGSDNVGILLGYGDGSFVDIMTYSTGIDSRPYSVAITDFNNDNQSDIVVANSESNNIAILFGYGNGTFSIGTLYSTGDRSRPYTVAIADFNNDNISDIAVANSGTNNIFLLYGDGNGNFENGIFYTLGYDYRPYSIAVKDLNEDGWMDIVVACYNTNNVEILMKMC